MPLFQSLFAKIFSASIDRSCTNYILNTIIFDAQVPKRGSKSGFGINSTSRKNAAVRDSLVEVKGPGGMEIHLWETDEPEVSQDSRPRQSLGRVPAFLRPNRVGRRSAKHASSRGILVKISLRTI